MSSDAGDPKPAAPAPPAPAKTWQDRYGPLIAAVAFAVLTALLQAVGISAPVAPPPPVAAQAAPPFVLVVTTSGANPVAYPLSATK